MEFTLLGAALTGAFGAWLGLRLPGLRSRVGTLQRPWDVLVGAAAIGVFAGRVVEMISVGVNPLTNPFDVMLVRGGVDTVAASIAALLTLGWVFRRELTALDTLAPAALLGLAGWHAGCLWTGSCLGAATGGDWGFTLPGSTIGRHPTELYAAAALAVSAVLTTRPRTPFVATGLALAAAGAVRAATQPIRPSLTGGPMWAYVAAIAVGSAIAAIARLMASRAAAISAEP
jgi:hypothetical protein